MASSSGMSPDRLSFSVVRRGFDQEQVGLALSRLEAELVLLRADRDSAVDRAARAARDSEDARRRVAELEQRVTELGRTPSTEGEMSERLATMLRLAREEATRETEQAVLEAAQIRSEAEDEAWRLRDDAERESAALRQRTTAELDAGREELRAEVARTRQDAEREATSIRELAAADAARVRAEAEQAASTLRESAERDRAAAAAELDAMRRRSADLDGERRRVLDAARGRAREIETAAEREAARLDAVSARRRQTIDEDHRIASDARRAESLRLVAEQTAASEREAAERVGAARAEADRLVTAAREEARATVDRARAHTEELLRLRGAVVGELAAVRARLEQVPGRPADYEAEYRRVLASWRPEGRGGSTAVNSTDG